MAYVERVRKAQDQPQMQGGNAEREKWHAQQRLPALEEPDKPEENRDVCEKEHADLDDWVCATHPLSQRLSTPVKQIAIFQHTCQQPRILSRTARIYSRSNCVDWHLPARVRSAVSAMHHQHSGNTHHAPGVIRLSGKGTWG